MAVGSKLGVYLWGCVVVFRDGRQTGAVAEGKTFEEATRAFLTDPNIKEVGEMAMTNPNLGDEATGAIVPIESALQHIAREKQLASKVLAGAHIQELD